MVPVILVVEDEPLLRIAAVDMIEFAGFRAAEAADASDAMAVLESRTDIRIVFTDIDMPPGVDGMTLATRIRNRWGPMHLVITSGYYAPSAAELAPGSLFFAKPYKEQEVVAAFAKMLA